MVARDNLEHARRVVDEMYTEVAEAWPIPSTNVSRA